jgi:Uma2 family endonuclease
MATVTKIGPADHGRPMTLDEFLTGSYEEGYKYELIDGKLYVSPEPNLPEGLLEGWLFRKLDRYSVEHPEVINWVHYKTRVFVPSRRRVTCPEPDLAAYHDFPLDADYRDVRWQDVSPILVGEVLSPEGPEKDLVRNVDLYLQVPSIREYWILDGRDDPNHPTLLVYRRRGQRWQRPINVAAGEAYTTRLLPGFELILDPRR